MKKTISLLLALLFLLSAAGCSNTQDETQGPGDTNPPESDVITVTDHLDNQVTVPADIERIAVVGVGTSIESSVLIATNLVDLGKPVIWAKAISSAHGRILQRIGAHHVVYPEADAGKRVAHLVNGRLLDFIEFDDDFAIVKMRAPREVEGKTLAEADIRQRFGVTVVGVKTPGKDFTYAVPETVVAAHDLLIVSGRTGLIEKFSQRA